MKKVLFALLGLVLITLGNQLPTLPTRWVVPHLLTGTVLEATYTPTPIKSIQYGSIAMTAGTGSNTATITSVDTTATAVTFGGNDCNDTASTQAQGSCFSRLTLTNATTITATRDASASVAASVQYIAVEYLAQFIRSRQEGVITLTAGSGTATITAVTVAKTALINNGVTTASTNTSQGNVGMAKLTLTNTTTVTCSSVNSITPKCGYTALEFK
jgi:hypothetical protein